MNNNYEQLGFNQFLQKNDSLPAQDRGYFTNTDVDYDFEGFGATQINFGVIKQRVDIGIGKGGYIRIDGANKRIVINDGTNDRVLIGYQASGF